jgi:hypothetical protein
MVGADLGAEAERGAALWQRVGVGRQGCRPGCPPKGASRSASVQGCRARVSGGETRARFVRARVLVLPIQ